jgi:hypothetical protein
MMVLPCAQHDPYSSVRSNDPLRKDRAGSANGIIS